MSFILDLNCNCSYCLLAQFVLTILCYSKLDAIETVHKTTSFHINKPPATIVHIVDILMYMYIAFFPRNLYILYGCTLNHIQFCRWLCCTHLHFLSLEIQKSSPWFDIHILDNQLQDMTKTIVHKQMWGRSIQNPWLRKTNPYSYSNPIERGRLLLFVFFFSSLILLIICFFLFFKYIHNVNCIIFYRMLRWWPWIWLCRPLYYMPQYFVWTIWRKLHIWMCWRLQRTSVSCFMFFKYNLTLWNE
jgi:hypothetical protein